MACGWVPGDVNNTETVTTLISPPQNISYVDSTQLPHTSPDRERPLKLKVTEVGGKPAVDQA